MFSLIYCRYDFNLWRLSSINRYVCLLCDNAKPGFDSKLKMQAHWEVKHEKYTMYRVCCICGVKQGAKSFIRHLKVKSLNEQFAVIASHM